MHLLHIAQAVALDGEPLSGASEAEAELIRSRVAATGKAYCAAVVGSLLMYSMWMPTRWRPQGGYRSSCLAIACCFTASVIMRTASASRPATRPATMAGAYLKPVTRSLC